MPGKVRAPKEAQQEGDKMSWKNFLVLNVAAAVAFGASSVAMADIATRARAAELSLHRVEKLIILKKIDASFQTAVNQLDLAVQPSDTDAPGGTYFRAIMSEVPAQDSTRKSVKLFMDDQGKTLIHKPMSGGDAFNPPIWPAKDPISLMEVAMHCVQGELIENSHACADHPELPAFNRDFQNLTLSQLRDAAGVPSGALATIQAEKSHSLLKIRINLDGTLSKDHAIEIIPNPPEEIDAVPAPKPPLEPKYSSIKREIFDQRCVDCHSPDGKAKKVPLSPWKELMDSPRELVIPGNVEESGLVIAIQRTDDKRMPPPRTGPPLPADEIKAMRDWIKQGAKDN